MEHGIFGAYIEDYNIIKVIVPVSYKYEQLFLRRQNDVRPLKIVSSSEYGNELHLFTRYEGNVNLNLDYEVQVDQTISYPLALGKIIRTRQFDEDFFYDGPLGIEYHKTETIFRVWSPAAKEIVAVLKNNQTGMENRYPLEVKGKGLWETRVAGDLDRYEYYYLVRIDTVFVRALDPYAVASSANSASNYVIDLSKTYSFKATRPAFSGQYPDAIIYELHVRDFTIDAEGGIRNRGKYLGLTEDSHTEKGLPTGLNYLKQLGITHLQLLPLNDFGGVDEKGMGSTNYNWGYNPVQYNVPEGWYATDANDPYSRINELRQMIDAIHDAGLLVNLDVVYNHVWEADAFSYNAFVPGYCFRYNAEGFLSNGSGCGNDIASERKMMRRFIIDSLLFWLNSYHVDGFRFDLMGLLDTDTMNILRQVLKSSYPEVMLYGEGWSMNTALDPAFQATKLNYRCLPGYGFFNDTFRNLVKGMLFTRELGYGCGVNKHLQEIPDIIKGSIDTLFDEPYRSLNFIECHDNRTFYDQLIINSSDINPENFKYWSRFALGLVLISQGVPFIHAGAEFFRSKKGIDNTYNLSDSINRIDWTSMENNYENVSSIRDLISIRKEYPAFRMTRREDIENNIAFAFDGNNIMFKLIGQPSNLLIILKNDFSMNHLHHDGATLIFDGMKKTEIQNPDMDLSHPGIYILKLNQ